MSLRRWLIWAIISVVALLSLASCSSGGGSPQAVIAPGCWSDVPAPQLATRPVELGGITALSERDIWAVGQQVGSDGVKSATLTLHWDGIQWSIVPSPNGPDTDKSKNNLYAVSGTSSNDVWAVGAYAPDGSRFKTLAMRWDGKAWSIVSTPNPGALDNAFNDVSAIAPNDMWAVGSYLASEQADAQMMAMRWDGKVWSQVATPSDGTHNLLSVRGVARNDVWAAGTQILRWNGTKWQIQDTPENVAAGYLDGIAVAGPKDVWVAGNNGNEAVLLRWDGTRWVSMPGPKLAAGPYPHDLAALSPDEVWVAGEYADKPATRQLLLMRWDGKTWSAIANPLPGEDTRLMGLTKAGSTLWAAGTRGRDSESKPLFLRYSPQPCTP